MFLSRLSVISVYIKVKGAFKVKIFMESILTASKGEDTMQ